MRSGYYQEIKGNFDGNFGNTLVSLDGSPINIMAQSPDRIVIEPETVPEAGIYSNVFAITAKLSGGYSVSAQLIVPELEPVPIDEVEKPKDPVEKCGFAWYGKWKKIKTITKADESQKQVVKSTHRKCTVCQKSSVWTYYKIPMFRYNVEERDKFTCTMIKGHAGSHHGTSKKEQREVAVGTAFRYKIVRTGDCCHTVFVKWKKK
jgi:hypothetical protein